MRICITGSSGWIGKKLVNFLIQRGHETLAINRYVLAKSPVELETLLKNSDAVINLVGAPIFQRWTTEARQSILSSRVDNTMIISEAILKLPQADRPRIFISASAIGVYKYGAEHDESSASFNNDFSGTVVLQWEKASEQLEAVCRRVIFRIGVVLGKDSQTIKKLLPIFRLGLGGKIGCGKQAFPFIHIDDLLVAFEQALTSESYRGVYNLVSPEKISNRQFVKKLARKVGKPALFPVPGIALRLVYGKAANLLLRGAAVKPKRLIDAGFKFDYPTMDSALTEIFQTKKAL